MKNRIWTLIPLVLFMAVVPFVTHPKGTASTEAAVSASVTAPASTADMRPVAWITTHGAPRHPGNPEGLRRQLVDPDEGYLWFMDHFLNRPQERFLIHAPAGWEVGAPQPNAAYWPIQDRRIARWKDAIRDAQRIRPEITIGIHGSLNLRFTHSTRLLGDWHRAKFNSPRDRWQVWQQAVAPWVRAGVYEYFWDNTSPKDARPDAVLFSQWLAEHHGVRAGMEALPTKLFEWRGESKRLLDRVTMNKMPSLCLMAFMRTLDGQNDAGAATGLNFEAIIILQPIVNESDPTLREAIGWLRRGFVLGSSRQWDEMLLEAYEIADQ